MKRLVALFFVIALPAKAQQHDMLDPGHWYDLSCCSGKDCAPIQQDWVHSTDSGYYVRIPPGGHPMLSGGGTWQSRVIPYSQIKKSQDQDFHACVSRASGGSLLCIYAPPMGF